MELCDSDRRALEALRGGPLRSVDIAVRIGVKARTARAVAVRLLRHGLVQRRQGIRDARYTYYALVMNEKSRQTS